MRSITCQVRARGEARTPLCPAVRTAGQPDDAAQSGTAAINEVLNRLLAIPADPAQD
jgi:hypothetical protein